MFNKLVSLVVLVILSPIFLFIAMIIFMNDGFPIFFRQKRIGKNNKIFLIYKFRTMRNDTPNLATHKLQSSKSYLIKSGEFLRKYSLDELPQFINVILGDMNIIGPRPALYNQHNLIKLRNKFGICSLRPGISGWAQINGRDNISIREKIDLDYYYLENKSIFLDIKILILTLKKVVFSENLKI